MGRVYFLTLYLFALLISACSINKVFAEIKEPKQIHLLTTVKYVVKVSCSNGTGSGVIVDGNILTAAHVVKDSYNCVISDYKGNLYQSYPIKLNEQKDLAILKTDKKLLNKGIRLALKTTQMYDSIYTIGFPLGYSYFMTKGQYQFTEGIRDFSNMNVIMGNSGGGVFIIENNTIRLVGIVHAIAMLRNGAVIAHMSSYINLQTIKEFINE